MGGFLSKTLQRSRCSGESSASRSLMPNASSVLQSSAVRETTSAFPDPGRGSSARGVLRNDKDGSCVASGRIPHGKGR